MLIDTHSHVNFDDYKKDAGEVIRRSLDSGTLMINVGTDYKTSVKAVEMALKYDKRVWAAIGYHPGNLMSDFSAKDFDLEKYRKLVLDNAGRVVAIGEIGLDYYYRPKGKIKVEDFQSRQKEVFIKQLELAKELNLPVIIHCRMAHTDLIEILKSQFPNPNDQKLHGVIHCFTGTLAEAEQYIRLGFYLGINGIIFSPFGRSAVGGKLSLDEVIKKTPLNKILVETDCPYLTPPQEGDKRNEPVFVKYVAERIAKIKNISLEKVCEITTQNARKLFGI